MVLLFICDHPQSWDTPHAYGVSPAQASWQSVSTGADTSSVCGMRAGRSKARHMWSTIMYLQSSPPLLEGPGEGSGTHSPYVGKPSQDLSICDRQISTHLTSWPSGQQTNIASIPRRIFQKHSHNSISSPVSMNLQTP